MSERSNDGGVKAATAYLRAILDALTHDVVPSDLGPANWGLDLITTTLSEQEAELERYRTALGEIVQGRDWVMPPGGNWHRQAFNRACDLARSALTHDSPEEGP